MKIRKRMLPITMAYHINIRLKSAMGNSINMLNFGLQVGHKQAARFCASLLIDDKWYFSITVDSEC